MAGSAAQIRSVIIESTIAVVNNVPISIQLWVCTSVSDGDVHDLVFRETSALDAHAPIGAQRPAHSQE